MSFGSKEEKTRKSGNHNRGGLPRALWMAMLVDINRGLTPFERELIMRDEAERVARAKLLKRQLNEMLAGTGVAA